MTETRRSVNNKNKASELPKEVIIVVAHDTNIHTVFALRLEVSIRLYVHIRIIAYVK